MSYSSMAVRFFTSPKPLTEAIVTSKVESKMASVTSSPSSVNGTAPTGEQRPNGTDASAGQTPQKKGITFSNQDSLPKLPIPDLESTCKKYLEVLYPLQTPREHEETKAAVQEFLRSEGPELQEKLKKYASSKTSYIEQFCTLRFSQIPLNLRLICSQGTIRT